MNCFAIQSKSLADATPAVKDSSLARSIRPAARGVPESFKSRFTTLPQPLACITSGNYTELIQTFNPEASQRGRSELTFRQSSG
jgi:hypothetical protein